MMKRFLTYISMALAVLVSCPACSDELMSTEEDLQGDGLVTIAANSSRLITKAGLQYTNFAPYTKYIIYGVENSATYNWEEAVMYDRQAWENEHQLIEYGRDLFFDGKRLDFYGATLCSTKASPENRNQPGSPVISFNLAEYGGRYPDLMYSNNLKGCTAQMGLLEMNFTHALSKIQVEISRQDEAELEGTTINSISIVNTSSNGTLDIVSGTWSTDGSMGEAVISEETLVVPVEPIMIKEGENEAYALIIPNETSKETVSLHIHLTTADGTAKVITYPLYASPVMTADGESQSEPFIFEQNHRYVLSIILLNDGVRVIAVAPQAFDWIDVNVPAYMGQPVNFGGLMWMDRNLGATSADCENDWANTRGFYYQFGRNIPYIFDQEKYLNRNRTVKNEYRTGDATGQLDLGYEYFFTYNERGERVYGAVQGGTLAYHYEHHVSELNVAGELMGWENDGSGWEWKGSTLTNYRNVATPKYLSNSGKFDYGGFWNVDQVGYNGTTSVNINEDPGAPQWTHGHVTTSNIAVNPGDPGIYHFIWDARYYMDHLQSGAWCVMDCKDPWTYDHWRNLTTDEWTAYYGGWDTGSAYPAYKGWLLNHGCPDTRTEDTDKVNYFWADRDGNPIPDNHPCPKGWRIPTKEDIASIMPDHNIENTWATTENTMYILQETYGDLLKAYKEAAIYGVDHWGRKVIYIIKRKGEEVCYRLRLLWKDSNLTRNSYYGLTSEYDHAMQYLEISRYPGNGEMNFDKYYNSELGELTTTNSSGTGSLDGININKTVRKMTAWQLSDIGFYDDYNWNNPTEVMQIPICGFIYPGNREDGMYGDGQMTILRCTDWSTNYDLARRLRPVEEGGNGEEYTDGAYPYNEGMNWCMYIRTNRGAGLFSGSRKTLGDQIRCVRDVNAK
ncbi:MAG: fimbrillin family protein [Bacteroidales bacterium]|nr:fimbrillin family protein [Bacteroidales bacterium]